MSEEQLKAFWEAVQADAGLQEKLKAAADADAVVAIAKAAGFVISAEELNKAQAELSDEELAGVAGGYDGIFCEVGLGRSMGGFTWAAMANAKIQFRGNYRNDRLK